MKEIINLFRQKGYLLAPELLQMKSSQLQELYSHVHANHFKIKILNMSIYNDFTNKKMETINNDFPNTHVEILKSFEDEDSKKKVNTFVEFYNDRFEKISSFLKNRPELSNVNSAKNISEENNTSKISMIGMVSNISLTKNNNMIITLEDPTGNVKIMITEKNSDLYKKSQDIVLDEVIGITGSKARGFIFANEIFFPDMPTNFEFKKSSDEVYAAFISDIHIGSTAFMEESFTKFIDWVKGSAGSPEQRETSKKLGYLFIIGDVVDGIGIYPSQENDLVIKDIYEQFNVFTKFIKQIPEHVQIIICPGNHDGTRIAEPQPPYPKIFLKELYEMKNVTMVSNPAYLKIHEVEGSLGFIVLMYHGYSLDHYCLDVQSLRNAGGYGAVEKVVEFLLKKRHLAPTHGSSLFVPSSEDKMIIEIVPDIVATGHIHNLRTSVLNHINVITCSCFERTTGETYAERLGHKPTPAIVPIINLKTRKVSVMDFN
ncbi:MAG: hypothetical protein GON13_00905 [Nanoarchaeota archaeon]|nr:hypothetical protein [Nanoarchaeota archaeon]